MLLLQTIICYKTTLIYFTTSLYSILKSLAIQVHLSHMDGQLPCESCPGDAADLPGGCLRHGHPCRAVQVRAAEHHGMTQLGTSSPAPVPNQRSAMLC